MNFSIVTPSFRNSRWLKLCIASVADQEGVTFEHIVQDSCSDDGTQDWLPQDRRGEGVIEEEKGGDDALNRGWKGGQGGFVGWVDCGGKKLAGGPQEGFCFWEQHPQGDFVAWLNCDEQYLPGALKAVSDYADQHPEVDLIVADTVVVDPEGKYMCSRQSMLPRMPHLWVRFSILSCGIFLRRKALEEKQ